MSSRVTLLGALSGLLALGCKSPGPADMDTDGSGGSSTSSPTTVDATTAAVTTALTTGDLVAPG